MATIYGTTGSDTRNGTSDRDIIYGWARGGNVSSPSGNDTLNGVTGDDKLFGGTGNDSLRGNLGNDTLDGGSGANILIGGAGNDTYIIDSTTDKVTEAAASGTDTVRSYVTYTLGDNLENLTLLGTSAIDGSGNSLNNIITGNRANNSLDGLVGNDVIYGGDGNDFINGGDGYDTLYGGNGDDELNGNFQGSVLYGGDGNDELKGSYEGNNVLYGGDGNDIIDGGYGPDTLTGGAGKDEFLFQNSNRGMDNITDFLVNDDTILASGDALGLEIRGGLGEIPYTAITPEQFLLGSAAANANNRFIYNQNTGMLFLDLDGTGPSEQVQFATLPTGLALTNTNILVNIDFL